MENVYIVSDREKWINKTLDILRQKISISEIIYDNSLSTEYDFDFWVKKNIKDSFEKLIIPIELGINNQDSVVGLKIAMHIRLLSDNRRYLPIVFVSNKNENDIRLIERIKADFNHFDYILGTESTDFIKPIPDDIIAILENIKALNPNDYKKLFYNNIKILPNESFGNHSLANIWGAYRLADITGNKSIIETNKIYQNLSANLYFKYLTAFNVSQEKFDEKLIIEKAKNKNILLIDDEADKGWADVLKAVFKESIFESVPNESNSTFVERAKDKALEKKDGLPKWDLILLDLRLIATEDQGDNANKKLNEYSGAQLLKDIKDDNKGTQVIIFTASNKAWNIQQLLEMGADGFYIKESPEYNFDASYSKENFDNFKKQVEKCLEMSDLRKFDQYKKQIEDLVLKQNENISKEFSEFYKKCENDLIISFDLFNRSRNTKVYKDYAFLQIFKVIEDFINLKEVFEYGDKCYVYLKEQKNIFVASLLKNKDTNNLERITKAITYNELKYEIKLETNTKKIDTHFKVSALLIFRYFVEGNHKKWVELNKKRNTVAHSKNNKPSIENIDLINLLEFLHFILDNKNINEGNLNNGLKIDNESLTLLTDKFNKKN